MTDRSLYVHHAVACAPRTSAAVAEKLRNFDWARQGAALYGIWRSQIGRPRDELPIITVWPESADLAVVPALMSGIREVRGVTSAPPSRSATNDMLSHRPRP